MTSSPPTHLTPAEIETVLDYLKEVDAVLVGGQSLAIWSRLYLGRAPQIARVYSMSSEDVDLYGDRKAAEAFAKKLMNAKVYIPPAFDPSPNAAVVVGQLGEKTIQVDFLRAVLGVDPRSLKNNVVTLTGPSQGQGSQIDILILHPLDCLRSRLSNINDLKRTDPHSISSAHAAVIILDVFIDDLLQNGETKKAQAILMSLFYVIRDRNLGRPSQTKFQVDPLSILLKYRLDLRLDNRWRSHQLANAISRLRKKMDLNA
ncbi:hypothetical protein [Bradyrhizobium amphicarpaeae]|nr:hypothetical protein [Bradyrhizobium amphicarpaeae]